METIHVSMPEKCNGIAVIKSNNIIYVNDNYVGTKNIDEVELVIF